MINLNNIIKSSKRARLLINLFIISLIIISVLFGLAIKKITFIPFLLMFIYTSYMLYSLNKLKTTNKKDIEEFIEFKIVKLKAKPDKQAAKKTKHIFNNIKKNNSLRQFKSIDTLTMKEGLTIAIGNIDKEEITIFINEKDLKDKNVNNIILEALYKVEVDEYFINQNKSNPFESITILFNINKNFLINLKNILLVLIIPSLIITLTGSEELLKPYVAGLLIFFLVLVNQTMLISGIYLTQSSKIRNNINIK